MIYTLPHDPDVLQAYCQVDQAKRRAVLTTNPKAVRPDWLDRLLGRRLAATAADDSPRPAEPLEDLQVDSSADSGTDSHIDPDDACARAKIDAMLQAAR